MCLNIRWLQMSLHSLLLLFVRSLVLRIFPFIPWCCHLLHVGYCRSIWKTLQTFLQVSILHPRHQSSWKLYSPSLSSCLLLHSWNVLHQWCRTTMSHNCIVYETSWSLIILFFILDYFLNCHSLVLRNKSHPSFLIGDCTWSFLQVKCISCMVRNIS